MGKYININGNKTNGLTAVGLVLFIVILVGVAIFGIPLLFKVCWNYAVAPTFGWGELTYWKAFAIVAIIAIIGGFFQRSSK